MIELINVSKKYNKQEVLNNINYKFDDTGLYILVGKSGCGKSTLFNILGLLDKDYNGKVIFNDKDITHIKGYTRKHVSFIFQNFYLISDYNGKENSLLAKYVNKIKLSNYHTLIDKFSLKKQLKNKPSKLSGGEQQRIALIRGIVKRPDIILCDEPTGSLDINNGNYVFDELKRLSKDCLVIVITHDLSLANKYGDEIIELNNGSLKTIKKKSHTKRSVNKVKIKHHFFLLSLKEVIKNTKMNYKIIFAIYLAMLTTMLTFCVVDGTKTQLKKEVENILPSSQIVISNNELDNSLLNMKKSYMKYRYFEPKEVEFLGLSLKNNYQEDQTIYINEQYNIPENNEYHKLKKDNDIVLSKNTAKKLFKGSNPINKYVYGFYYYNLEIKALKFRVVSISNKRTLLDAIFIKEKSNINNIKSLYNLESVPVSLEMITIKNTNNIQSIIKELKKDYPKYKIKTSNGDLNKNIDDISNKANLVLILFSMMAVVSSCFLIGEVLYLSIVQRKHKLGIFMTMGASKIEIMTNIILETLIIVSISFLIAYTSLRGLSLYVNEMVSELINVESLKIVTINNTHILLIFLLSIFLAIISSILPAIYSLKLDVIEVLKE